MVKTITIDIEAYHLLSAHKHAGQSFSQVIKAHFGPRPTAGRFRDLVQSVRTGADALDHMDGQVRKRGRHPAPAVRP